MSSGVAATSFLSDDSVCLNAAVACAVSFDCWLETFVCTACSIGSELTGPDFGEVRPPLGSKATEPASVWALYACCASASAWVCWSETSVWSAVESFGRSAM